MAPLHAAAVPKSLSSEALHSLATDLLGALCALDALGASPCPSTRVLSGADLTGPSAARLRSIHL